MCVSQTKLGVVSDSMAAGLLRAVSRLLDLSVLPLEPVLRFLSQCCLSLLSLLLTLQQEAPTETNHKRCAWNSFSDLCWLILIKCVNTLAWHLQGSNLGCLRDSAEQHSSPAAGCPAVVARCQSERGGAAAARTDSLHAAAAHVAPQPAAGQHHSAARNPPAPHGKRAHTDAGIFNWRYLNDTDGDWSPDYFVRVFQRFSRGATREQWLTDLLYCYSVTVAHGSSAHRGNLGLRDIY